jgi:hypothetical protein
MDIEVRNYNLKYLDYNGKVMINILTTASNKILKEVLESMPQWNKDFFKLQIEKQGHILEYIQLTTY